MYSEQDFLKDLWRDSVGLPEEKIERVPDLEKLKETQWCPEFEMLMRARLIMGAFRYGLVITKNSKSYDHMSSIPKRIENYKQTGNLENLVDISNLCLLEFLHSEHPNKHFKAADDAIHSSKK